MHLTRTNPLSDPPFRSVLMLFLLSPAIAVVLALGLSEDNAGWFLSEHGPIEQLSPLLWSMLAVFVLGLFGPRSPGAWAGSALSAAAGLRELGLHNSLTGDSMLKIAFYFKDEQPMPVRLACLAIVLVMACSAAVLIVRGRQLLRGCSPTRMPSWAWICLMSLAALVISKVFDRSQAMIEDAFGFEMHQRLALVIRAIEESTEMLLPLAFGAAMLCLALTPIATRHERPIGERD